MSHYKLQQGIALISVLICMLIFSLLSLCALENNLLELKIVLADWHKQQLITAAKQQVSLIAQQLPKQCIIKPMAPKILLDQPLAAWQQLSCTGNFQGFLYYYVIEPLGNVGSDSAAYYRVSLLLIDAQQAGRTILQATVVQVCNAKTHITNNSLQSVKIVI